MRISHATLVRHLTDLDRLMTPPTPGERVAEASTTDRRSQYDADTDRYLHWDANDDGSGNLGTTPDGGLILACLDGPGCIRHIWTALAGTGTIRFRLDDKVFEFPFSHLFEGTGPLFPYPGLCCESAGGRNCWVPIPFARHCEVSVHGDWGAFCQIHHTVFPAETEVEPFTLPLSAEVHEALAEVSARYEAIAEGTEADGTVTGAAETMAVQETIEAAEAMAAVAPLDAEAPLDAWKGIVHAGGTRCLLEARDAGILRSFRLRVATDGTGLSLPQGLPADPEDPAACRLLKALTLTFFWDGASQPAIRLPLGDFFGCPCGFTPYQTLAMGFSTNGWFHCDFPMPFAKGARIEIGNDGDFPVAVEVHTRVAPVPHPDELTPLRFRAGSSRHTPDHGRADRWPDKTLFRLQGAGQFVGMGLHVAQYADNGDPNAREGWYWWGEGDEKIFVDGERFPSLFGTGVEDYFGYAWALTDLFSRGCHAQIRSSGGIHDRGDRALVRVHVADAIPFQTSLEFSLEKYHGDRYVQFDAVAWWYGDAETPAPQQVLAPLSERISTSFWAQTAEPAGVPVTRFPEGWTYSDPAPSMTVRVQRLDAPLPVAETSPTTPPAHPLERIPAANPVPDPYADALPKDALCLEIVTSDAAPTPGWLQSPPFRITTRTLDFLMAGTAHRDPAGLFVELVDVEMERVLVRTGGTGATPRRVLYLTEDHQGVTAVLRVRCEASGAAHWLRLADLHLGMTDGA